MSNRKGFIFKEYSPPHQEPFDKLFGIFKELITYTSGDVDEALDWMRELDKEYKLTTPEYTMDDFIEDLKKKGYIKQEIDPTGGGKMGITAKTERAIRQQALDQIFGKLKRSGSGNHKTKQLGFMVQKIPHIHQRLLIFNRALHQSNLSHDTRSSKSRYNGECHPPLLKG